MGELTEGAGVGALLRWLMSPRQPRTLLNP